MIHKATPNRYISTFNSLSCLSDMPIILSEA
jgi:hypothetical protein